MIILAMLMPGMFGHLVGSMNFSAQEIPFEKLVRGGMFFEKKGTQSYESILFDFVKDQIILGAKDTLLRLDTRLNLLEKQDLHVPRHRIQKCMSGSRSEEDCLNYIPVLHVFDVSQTKSVVYACGTYAFEPMCFVMDITKLSNPEVMKEFSGGNKAPRNPTYRGICASWLNAAPDKNLLFIGTFLDSEVQTSNIVVSEMSNKPTFKPKKVGGSLKLQNAEFAGSFHIDEFVYFVFRENAVEKPAHEISSRIGRVCADGDAGNPGSLSFTKVRLECADFDTVQRIFFLQIESKLFATFSKRTKGHAKSAICQYDYIDIENAFSGDFWCQKDATSPWGVCPPRPLGEKNVKTCYGERNADDLRDRILWNATVLPYCGGPRFEHTEGNVLFSALAVESSNFGYYDYKAYVGDDRSGRLWNINLGYCNQSEVYEIWEVTRPADRLISPEIISVKIAYGSVYVLTCCGLFKYPGLNFIPTTKRTIEPINSSSPTHPSIALPPHPIIRAVTATRELKHSSNVKPVSHPVMLTISSAFMIFQRLY